MKVLCLWATSILWAGTLLQLTDSLGQPNPGLPSDTPILRVSQRLEVSGKPHPRNLKVIRGNSRAEGNPSGWASPEDRSLSAQLDLPPDALAFFGSLKDEGMKQQAEELRVFMRQLAPAVGGKKGGDKTYADYLKIAKKKLTSLRKKQVTRYEEWRKQSWTNIQKYLEANQRVLQADDDMNVMENEKYYQLFLVEDGDKRQHVIPFLNLENRLLEIIDAELEVVEDELSLKKASARQAKRLSDRLARRARRASRRNRRAYLRGVRALNDQYMRHWQRNELFAGEYS